MPIAINEQIKSLIELQKIDGEIYKLRKELLGLPVEQKRLEAEFEKKKSALKNSEDTLKALQVRQKQNEGELQSAEEKIKKLQSQLYQLKSNKEYTAMQLEIKGFQADKSVLEEDILKLLEEGDEARAGVAREKEKLAKEDRKLKEETVAIQKRSTEISATVQALEEKRKVYTPKLEPRLVAQYEKILKSREGLALAPVRNNACGGCHMGMPPQSVNEIQLGEKLVVCESCTRILYWPS